MIENLLLHGGGLDSTAVFLHLIRTGIPFEVMHVDYGHVASMQESEAIEKQCKKYSIVWTQVTTPFIRKVNSNSLLFGDPGATEPILDSRNMTVAMIGSYYGNNLYMGLEKPFMGAKSWPDCSQEFIDAMNLVFKKSYLTRDVKIITPFFEVEKLEVYKQAYRFDPGFFSDTMTCWTPKDGECGTCKHCLIKTKLQEEIKNG